MRGIQRRIQFLNINKDRYPNYFKKIDDFLYNSAKVSFKDPRIRGQILDDTIGLIDEFERAYSELKLNRDDIIVSLGEVNPQGKVLNVESLNAIIRDMKDMHDLLGEIKDSIFTIKDFEERGLQENDLYDLKAHLDRMHDRAPQRVKNTALHYRNLIDYLYF
jgi:hypothetical protein